MLLRICLWLLCATLWIPTAALAVDEADLLPIDEAFVLTATASERGRIEFNWKIADGYYLYRHRTNAKVESAGFKANPLQLPDGDRHTDEFFGEVETYRGSLVGILTGAAADGVTEVSFKVGYQGCADLGVCYPPHTQIVNVSLPAGPASAMQGLSTLPFGNASKPQFGNAAPVSVQADGLPLPEEQAFTLEAIPLSGSTLLLRFTPATGYYLYRDRSSFKVIEGEGVALLAPQWPPAKSHYDEHFGDVAVYFEQVEVPLPLTRERLDKQALLIEATFQGCQTDGICYPPMTRQVRIELPAATTTAPASKDSESAPAPVGEALGFGVVMLTLLSAVIGGLILNLMPCVLPVLSLKVLSLAEGGRDNARRSALWYTAGVLASFVAVGGLALLLRSAGLALGWGFQLQQPLAIGALAYVMLAVGLSLSGVFQLGASLAGAGQSLTEKKGAAGDFFTGVLAVVVASPCTAPFMGPALAFAFAAPSALAIGVFLALGLGLALPFLLIGFIPTLANRLPKSGAWMNTFKQVMAFPMYLTAAWLVSILAAQRGADGVLYVLVGAVVLALGLWWREQLRYRDGAVARAMAIAVILLSLWPLWATHRLPQPQPGNSATTASETGAQAYSSDALAELRQQGRVVFVNMTADWCVSCKVNEKAVLSQDGFLAAMKAANAVYMKGDWTNVDPAITAFLKSHNAVGVPLYVVYPAGGGDGVVLPTILTAGIVEDALQQAAAK
ncbi:MAG: protein-disulfide reductase DsbD family protein [Pseudomarimonas sp.]